MSQFTGDRKEFDWCEELSFPSSETFHGTKEQVVHGRKIISKIPMSNHYIDENGRCYEVEYFSNQEPIWTYMFSVALEPIKTATITLNNP